VYKGTEGPYPYSCLNDVNATFIAKHTIKVTKSTDGKGDGLRRELEGDDRELLDRELRELRAEGNARELSYAPKRNFSGDDAHENRSHVFTLSSPANGA